MDGDQRGGADMPVGPLIRRLTDLDRSDAELGVAIFDRMGGLTIASARDVRTCDNREADVTFPFQQSDYQAVLIVAGDGQPALAWSLSEPIRPRGRFGGR